MRAMTATRRESVSDWLDSPCNPILGLMFLVGGVFAIWVAFATVAIFVLSRF
jgi:hypothetical protein